MTIQRSALSNAIILNINRTLLPVVSPKKALDPIKWRKTASVLGHQIKKHNPDMSLSDCMWYAYDEIKKFPEQYQYISFKKKSGEIIKRVSLNAAWSSMNTPKGTGRPLKEGQVLFIDAASLLSGKHSTRSTYQSSIIEKF